MKLAHLADLHLGFRQFHRTLAGGINVREDDVERAFTRAVEQIEQVRPDLIVVAGDVFHSPRPSNRALLFAYRAFQRLANVAPVVIVAGNHDQPRSIETGSILPLFSAITADHPVHVSLGDQTFDFPQLDTTVRAVADAGLRRETRQFRPQGDYTHHVLVLHGDVPEVTAHWDVDIEYGGAKLRKEELTTGWSYVALGDYHARQEIAFGVWYSGSLDFTSTNPWPEVAVPKGWILADLDTGAITPQLTGLSRRALDLPAIDAAGLDAAAVSERIRAALEAEDLTDAIVRLKVLNLPRTVRLQLDHAPVKAASLKTLSLKIDYRKPEDAVEAGASLAARERGKSLPELVLAYLERRELPPGVDRQQFVQLGGAAMQDAGEERHG